VVEEAAGFFDAGISLSLQSVGRERERGRETKLV
jgi:hypothetical protein